MKKIRYRPHNHYTKSYDAGLNHIKMENQRDFQKISWKDLEELLYKCNHILVYFIIENDFMN